MTSPSAHWAQVKTLFATIVEDRPADWRAWLARECGQDEALCREVEALVDAHEASGGFLEGHVLEQPDAALAVAGATASADPGQSVPTGRFGGYRIVRELGRGGMGVVYLAARDDDQFEKLVAIKVMSGDRSDVVASDRFVEERHILASLDHPGIARLIDAGTSESGSPYVVMEYVEGRTIDDHCEEYRLSIGQRLTLFCHVCEAVQYSHEHLVVHRDIKARNILVTSEGMPKLLDFGIAKLLEPAVAVRAQTQTAFRVLTPESASPEQIKGEPVTVASDVYSLGVLFYRLLTGRSPYREALVSNADVVRAICDEEPPRPSTVAPEAVRRELRGDLDLILAKALRKEPARRYATVLQFAQDVQRHQAHLPIVAAPDAWRYRAGKFVARHRLALVAAALVVLALTGGMVVAAWQARVARAERARADARFNDVRRLANSFLFEFHDAIEPLPGSTKARELVVRRATEYLDSLSRESSHDLALERELAASYERVGDVQGLPTEANLGDIPGALKSHRAALALRQGLASALPNDASVQRELAVTYAHVALILSATRDFAAALDHSLKSLEIREAIYAKNPMGAVERRSLANGYFYVGDAYAGKEEWAPAIGMFERQAGVLEAMLVQEPANMTLQRDVGIAYKRIGGIEQRAGDVDGALVNYRKAVALDSARVSRLPNDRAAKLDLSFGLASIATALAGRGDLDGALDHHRRSLALRETVAAADTNDVNAADAVARAHLSLGEVLAIARRHVEAIGEYRQAAIQTVARHKSDPGNTVVSERLATIQHGIANSAVRLGEAPKTADAAKTHWREAKIAAEDAIGLWTELSKLGPLSTLSANNLADTRRLLATSIAALK